MLPFHPLATAVQADRERDIRDRSPLRVGLPSGPRHPVQPETGEAGHGTARVSGHGPSARRPRVAFGEAR